MLLTGFCQAQAQLLLPILPKPVCPGMAPLTVPATFISSQEQVPQTRPQATLTGAILQSRCVELATKLLYTFVQGLHSQVLLLAG